MPVPSFLHLFGAEAGHRSPNPVTSGSTQATRRNHPGQKRGLYKSAPQV